MESRHHQHIGRVFQPAERILRQHQLAVERYVRAHLAVILKIDTAPVENFHRVLHALCPLARRMAEGGKSQQRHARLIAQPPRDARRLDGNLGNLFRIGQLRYRRVGDNNRAAARQHQRHADHAMAGLGVNDAAHFLKADREIAGDAGDHRVGVANRHHGRAKAVAVLVYQALAVAVEKALALQPLVEKLRVDNIAVRQAGVVNLDVFFIEINARRVGHRMHTLFAPHNNSRAHALIGEGHRRADDLLFLALGKYDALGETADALNNALQHAGDRIAPRRQLRLIGLHVGDGFTRHACLHRGFGDGDRNDMDKARVERHGNDIVAAKARARALIGGSDLVGHILARQGGKRVGGGDLHFHVDGGGAHIQRAAENIGKAQNIIDLVGVVRTACRHNHVVAHGLRVFRCNFRVGIGHGENDRVFGHALDHGRGQRALGGEAKENISALHRLFQRAQRRVNRMR